MKERVRRNRVEAKTKTDRKTVKPNYLDLERSSYRKSEKQVSARASREYKRDMPACGDEARDGMTAKVRIIYIYD